MSEPVNDVPVNGTPVPDEKPQEEKPQDQEPQDELKVTNTDSGAPPEHKVPGGI